MRGLLVDYGGVLTTSVFASFAAFCRAEGLPDDRVVDLLRGPAQPLLAGLEDGTLPAASFEAEFAALLGVPAGDLIARMMAGATVDRRMAAAVRQARRHGIRTGLVSNSWGLSGYDQPLLAELFDGVVLSAEAGVRKPAPEIYRLGAAAVGLPPRDCVFVDDLGGNLKPAARLGMATVRHDNTADTIAALERLFGRKLEDPCD
ncbi:HAD family hydrolase [Phytohabitans rumicis]|uniref:Haloacid dehalogenase n=1 Tax=Phytohabitans rumicis TaxID=1076125 RepID=A0A6V8KX89_9ACTN|nr:HAD family phosphatase [Phytohabitans rumicis]GFJ86456.1 haloacid dehalogenase [Phytohabitans rumicis]